MLLLVTRRREGEELNEFTSFQRCLQPLYFYCSLLSQTPSQRASRLLRSLFLSRAVIERLSTVKGGRDQHRYVILTPFSKKKTCREIFSSLKIIITFKRNKQNKKSPTRFFVILSGNILPKFQRKTLKTHRKKI